MRSFVLFAFIAAGISSPALAGSLAQQPVSMPSPYRPMSSGSDLRTFPPKAQLRPMAPRWGFGLGVGVKYNLTEPSHDLLAQLVAKCSYGTAAQTGGTTQLATTALFVGAGFEAFVPGWDWLSLEGSAGATLNSQDLEPTNGGTGASQSTSNLSLGGNGFSPVNLSIHVYF